VACTRRRHAARDRGHHGPQARVNTHNHETYLAISPELGDTGIEKLIAWMAREGIKVA